MTDFVTSLRSTYDVILLDSAPLGAGVDALALASLAGNFADGAAAGKDRPGVGRGRSSRSSDDCRYGCWAAVLNDVRDESEYPRLCLLHGRLRLTNEPRSDRSQAGKQGASSRAAG